MLPSSHLRSTTPFKFLVSQYTEIFGFIQIRDKEIALLGSREHNSLFTHTSKCYMAIPKQRNQTSLHLPWLITIQVNLFKNIWCSLHSFSEKEAKWPWSIPQCSINYIYCWPSLIYASVSIIFSENKWKSLFFPSIADEIHIYLLKINNVGVWVWENAQSSNEKC